MNNPLRVLVCGNASSTAAVVRRLAEISMRDQIQVDVVETSDSERSTVDIARKAMTSDVAVVVGAGEEGITLETRKHAYLLLTLGVWRVVFALERTELAHADVAWKDLERECVALSTQFRPTVASCVPAFTDTLPGSLLPVGDVETKTQEPSIESKADRFEAAVVWLSDRPLLQSRSYVMRIGATQVSATVAPLKYRVDQRTFQPTPAKTLDSGDIGVCNLELTQAVPFDAPRQRFELLDDHGETVGVGLLHFALHRSQNVRWQALDIDKAARAASMGQRPCVIWFTGLSGAGKSTIANAVEKRLHALGRHTYLLDGDNVRHGLNKDLGFTDADRVENIRRVAEVARLMVDAGLVVLVSFISPFRSERRMARALFGEGEFLEVFVDTPLDVAESRDPKGLYRKARRGELRNFTGVDSPYEVPERAELRLDTTHSTPEAAAQTIISYLESNRAIIRPP